MTSPLGKKLGTIGYFKKQILGVKMMEMDSGVSHLTIVPEVYRLTLKKLILSNLSYFYL